MLRDDELALMYEGINRYLDDYQRDVTTRDEMVMVFSLEYKLARPSEIKRMIDQMLKEGYLVERGDYIRFTEVNMDPKTYRYSVPGGKKWKSKVKKAEQKPKVGPKAKPKAAPRRESAWDIFRRTKIVDEPMYEPDEGEYYEDELSASYDEYLGSTYPYEVQQKMRRRKTPIRGRGYMMIPDDGTGHVPASYLESVQAKRSPRSRAMDVNNRSQTVYPSPPSMDDGARWIRHPNRYDIEGIDTPKRKDPYIVPKGSKQAVLFNRRSRR